jgi:hypothetical protein
MHAYAALHRQCVTLEEVHEKMGPCENNQCMAFSQPAKSSGLEDMIWNNILVFCFMLPIEIRIRLIKNALSLPTKKTTWRNTLKIRTAPALCKRALHGFIALAILAGTCIKSGYVSHRVLCRSFNKESSEHNEQRLDDIISVVGLRVAYRMELRWTC